MADTAIPTAIPSQLPDNPASFWGRNNRNLWIILGSVLGVLALLFGLGVFIIVHRQLRRKGLKECIIPGRPITPLDDAEFESWRRPSMKSQSYGRYTTMMPRRPSPTAKKSDSYRSFDKELFLMSRPRTSSDPTQPPPSKQPNHHVRRKSSMSVHDRPPTPYSARCSEEEEGWPSPPRRASRGSRGSQGSRSPRQVRDLNSKYSSVSEASDFDFGFRTVSSNRPIGQAGIIEEPKRTHTINYLAD